MSYSWGLGVVIVLVFVLLGELAVAGHDYLFHRIGVNRNLLLFALWLLPIAAAFVATRFATRFKALNGLSFALVVPLLGAFGHYVAGVLGVVTDLSGIPGALTTFKTYLVFGGITSAIGTGLGLLISNPPRE